MIIPKVILEEAMLSNLDDDAIIIIIIISNCSRSTKLAGYNDTEYVVSEQIQVKSIFFSCSQIYSMRRDNKQINKQLLGKIDRKENRFTKT